MNQHILIINGALRKNGNTDALARAFARGARAAGIKVRNVALRERSISDCRGCYQCREKGTCSIHDDMDQLREAVRAADVIVFASPLYFCGVTGLLREFLDRLYFFYHQENNHHIAGKLVVILIPFGEKESGHEIAIAEEFFKRYLRALNLVPLSMNFFPDLMEKDALKRHPEMVDQAYYLGRSIQIQLRKLDIGRELKMLKLQFGVPKKRQRVKG